MFTKDYYKWQKKYEEILVCGSVEAQKLENNIYGFLLGIPASLYFVEFFRIALKSEYNWLSIPAFVGFLALSTYLPGATFYKKAKYIYKKAQKESESHPYVSTFEISKDDTE